jgi:hypothetical protein
MCVGYVSSALLARVWRILGLAVVCIRGVCVFEFDVSGACLARVWRVSGAGLDARMFFVCLALVWRVSGARRLRRGRVERVWLQIWFNRGLFARRVPVCVFYFICLLRFWRAPRAGLARVCCVCLVWSGVCVWCVSGACLVIVWSLSGACQCVVCLARVWCMSGACLACGACAKGEGNVPGASRS